MVATKVIFASGRRFLNAKKSQAKGLKDRVVGAVRLPGGARKTKVLPDCAFLEIIPEVLFSGSACLPDEAENPCRITTEEIEDPKRAARRSSRVNDLAAVVKQGEQQGARASASWQDEATTDTLPNMPVGEFEEDSDSDSDSDTESTAPSRACSKSSLGPARGRAPDAARVWQAVGVGIREVGKVQKWGRGYKQVRTLAQAEANYGSVELMELLAKGTMAAVKHMPRDWTKSGPDEFDRCWPEASERPWYDYGVVQYLQKHDFPYICQMLGTYQDETTTYFASAFASRGDLFNWLRRTNLPPGSKREAAMRPIFVQLVKAVCHLHDLGITHRDLSLENVVLHGAKGEEPQLKLIDFGMATVHRTSEDVRGKPPYQAPEMHEAQEHDTFVSDAFAVGVIGFAMAAGDYPWLSTKPGGCKNFTRATDGGFFSLLMRWEASCGPAVGHGPLADSFTEPLQEMLEGLLAAEPSSRLTLRESCWNYENCSRQHVTEMEWLRN
mmetsp:Transcript_27368/g.78862  ORF Transcript_27368/g.78862 Transcript_27368/m.78862 type:complete len:497 (+) Transcript_27368:121-1611(+)